MCVHLERDGMKYQSVHRELRLFLPCKVGQLVTLKTRVFQTKNTPLCAFVSSLYFCQESVWRGALLSLLKRQCLR